MRIHLIFALLLTGFAAPSQAANVQVVPGSGAAYLYFPADGEDNRTVLKFIKEIGGSLDDKYKVYFTFENDPKELLCDETDLTCEKTLGAGKVKLEIEGDWAPGNASVKLGMKGKFSGACSGVDTSCEMVLQAGKTVSVNIKVGCDAKDYSVIDLGGGDEALCVGYSADGKNNILLAAHKKIESGLRPKDEKEEWGYKDPDNGIANTEKIISKWKNDTSESAAHYCKNLSIGSGSKKLMEWYLPSINELKKVLAGWNNQDFTVPKANKDSGHEDGYYSSTENGKEKTKTAYWSSSSSSMKVDDTKYKYKDGATLCIKGISP